MKIQNQNEQIKSLKQREERFLNKIGTLEELNKDLNDKYERELDLFNSVHNMSHSIDIQLPES